MGMVDFAHAGVAVWSCDVGSGSVTDEETQVAGLGEQSDAGCIDGA